MGLAVSAFEPVIGDGTYTPRGRLIDDALGSQYTALEFESIADGGWNSGRITLTGSLNDMEAWFDDGLNRHIEIYNPALELIWAGFVNQVQLSAGTLTATRGPLLEVVNRCSVTYTPILDATTDPPTTGTQTVTIIEDDDDSIAKYGILEQVVSGGQLLDDDATDDTPNRAETLRDTYLDERAQPQSSEELGLGSSSEPSVTLELLGYVHRFGSYIVQDPTTETVTISDDDGTGKIQRTIAADPSGIFSTDYTRMEDNALLTSRFEDGTRDAYTIITELAEQGDANNDRMTFGIYASQRAAYAVIPDDVAYQHRIADRLVTIEQYGSGVDVRPWDVLPARWVFLSDFLVGRSQPTERRDDPRYIFIESVRFSAPYNIQINGGKISTIKQMLAKQGMW